RTGVYQLRGAINENTAAALFVVSESLRVFRRLVSRCLGYHSILLVMPRFVLCWADVTQLSVAPLGVEPVNPFHRCSLHVSQVLPRAQVLNYLSFVKPVDRLSQRIIVSITSPANRGGYTSFA